MKLAEMMGSSAASGKVLGRPAEAEEVAELLGLELEDFFQLLDETKCVSIVPLENGDRRSASSRGGDRDLTEILQDEKLRDSLQTVHLTELREVVLQAIEALPDKEKLLISLYYYEELTMKEVGEALGVGESRVSQIHSVALVRLRARLEEILNSRQRPSETQYVRNSSLGVTEWKKS
jgi:RNA polymerase sigma factor for flagellar operon FliA